MPMKPFSQIVADALEQTARSHGSGYAPGAAAAWGLTAASYIGFALCGFPATRLRSIQYDTKQKYGPIIMDCKWYNVMKDICLNGGDSVTAGLPSREERIEETTVTGEMLLEALDFCREG